MKGKSEKGPEMGSPRLLQVDEAEDLHTTPGGSLVGSVSVGNSPFPSPIGSSTGRLTGAMLSAGEDDRRTSALSSTSLGDGTEEVPTTTGGGYWYDEKADVGGFPKLGGARASKGRWKDDIVDTQGIGILGGAGKYPFARQVRSMNQQPLTVGARQGSLKPHRARLGTRHYVVPADATDIERMEQGKNLVIERLLAALLRRSEHRATAPPTEVRYIDNKAYDVHFLEDETELWHRRFLKKGFLARMLSCCD